ncbi:TetR/AcrR family transcriptional regulator [Nocardia sp. NPDC058499]|uniref:TetR/AcrR family transcriptional regulator n=1 Tax=Nocardia sp. NPDC058499 TaxID=3346530 RepID=UPI003667CEC1
MARRLSPEARRAEIIATTQEAIASDGYRALSLREVARRCGMSAPGLMHYFPDMGSLLAAVLDRRDETDLAVIFDDAGNLPLLELFSTARGYYAARAGEAESFDALEAEALDPGHPAHDYFVRRNERTLERMRPRIEREFVNADHVLRLMGLLLDGIRLRHLRSVTAGEADTNMTESGDEWLAVRYLLETLPRRSEPDPPGG